MVDDGEIYSINAVSDYGDYKLASLTRASWMHDWIKENVDLSYISDFHGLYDPFLRAIKIWVVRKGCTEIDTALLYFIDREPADAWMIFNNDGYSSGYNASAATAIKDPTNGSYKIYTGDYGGVVWELNKPAREDNGNGYYAGFKTPNDAFDNPSIEKLFNRMKFIVEPKGNYYLQAKIWIDGMLKVTGTVSLEGSGVYLDVFMLDTDLLADQNLSETNLAVGVRGKRIQVELYNSNASEDFFVSGYMTEFKSLGIPIS
jgi:hypothetical protein